MFPNDKSVITANCNYVQLHTTITHCSASVTVITALCDGKLQCSFTMRKSPTKIRACDVTLASRACECVSEQNQI